MPERQEPEAPKPKGWTLTQKLMTVSILVLISPAIVGGLQIWDWFMRPSGPLFDVTAYHGAFEIPPQLGEVISDLWEQHYRATVKPAGYIPEGFPEDIDTASDLIVPPPRIIWESFENFELLKGYLALSINNRGDRTAEEVAIQWTGEGIAAIQYQDGVEDLQLYKDRLELGRLKVEDSLTVRLWTTTRFDPKQGGPPMISHSTGSQRIAMSTFWFQEWWTFVAVAVLVVLVSFCIVAWRHPAVSGQTVIGRSWNAPKSN